MSAFIKGAVVGMIALVVGVATYRALAAAKRDHTTVVIDDIARFVESVSFEHESEHAGANVLLSSAGLELGNDRDAGAWALAGWLMQQEAWRGNRSRHNVSEEIWAHCVAWRRLPALRGRANPVNIEFYSTWPRSLLSVAISRVRGLTKSASTRTNED